MTGGNKGIGKALCKKIVAENPDTFVYLGARDAARGSQAVQDIVGELGEASANRIQALHLDVNDSSSVRAAAAQVQAALGDAKLYGVVNNAGIGVSGYTVRESITTNVYGPKLVVDAFTPLLQAAGRVVNISSASGPMYVAKLEAADQAFFLGGGAKACETQVTWEQLAAKMEAAAAVPANDATSYGFSKACLNVLTMQQAAAARAAGTGVLVNACTPGFIATELTAGMGATNPPEMGCKAPLHLLFGDLGADASGFYYGSDAVRSPLDRYRGPGDAPYEP